MPTTLRLGMRQTSSSKDNFAKPLESRIFPRNMYPFCWHGIPFDTSARANSFKTASGFVCDVVETLHSALPVTTDGVALPASLPPEPDPLPFLGVSIFFTLSGMKRWKNFMIISARGMCILNIRCSIILLVYAYLDLFQYFRELCGC